MEYDIVIVGAGPAGLACAIKLKQIQPEITICILEKGAYVGAHILSGAVIETDALSELLPEWRTLGAPVTQAVTSDAFYVLTKNTALPLPTPPQMRNHGNFIISLSQLCRWLGDVAQSLGVEIYPGFCAKELCYDSTDRVIGIKTGDVGINKDGTQSDRYEPGMMIQAKHTILAEGCRGYLTEELIAKFNLREHAQPQTYALGIKEIWEVDNPSYSAGSVIHTVGWPLDHATYGGSFLYHMDQNRIVLGFVVGLDYHIPTLSPFNEFQRYKAHPKIKPFLENGRRLQYGARCLNEGGWQSIPKLTVPGALIIGDGAGFLNVPKIKGTHNAIRSGMLAAQACVEELSQEEVSCFREKIEHSNIAQELKKVRNIRPGFRYGLIPGLIYAAVDTYVLRGRAPWTFGHHLDHLQTRTAAQCKTIDYPKPDGVYTFDRLSSVYLSNVFHEENQPSHLIIKDPEKSSIVNKKYNWPEQHYCPANVYEIVYTENQKELQINAQNCIHCKCCDIKDPTLNIQWVPPEGGGGPNYTET